MLYIQNIPLKDMIDTLSSQTQMAFALVSSHE